jgi:hypothetical protein
MECRAIQELRPIVFDTNFDVDHQNSLSLRERARVRESNKEYHSFFLSSCAETLYVRAENASNRGEQSWRK